MIADGALVCGSPVQLRHKPRPPQSDSEFPPKSVWTHKYRWMMSYVMCKAFTMVLLLPFCLLRLVRLGHLTDAS